MPEILGVSYLDNFDFILLFHIIILFYHREIKPKNYILRGEKKIIFDILFSDRGETIQNDHRDLGFRISAYFFYRSLHPTFLYVNFRRLRNMQEYDTNRYRGGIIL